jgi:glycerophosphoryl diester phosphodiesterase
MRTMKLVWLPVVLGILNGCEQQDNDRNTAAPQAPAPSTIGADLQNTTSLSRLKALRHRLQSPQANDVMVIAHRACWREAPENSLPAIDACIRMGVDMVEIDVHVTADGKLIIMHDDTVDRTTNGSGLISDLTLAQIKELSLKEGLGGPDAALTEHKVPTLEEALAVIRGNVLVNLDAKGETLLQSLAVARHLNMTDHVLFKTDNLSPEHTELFKDVHFMPIIRESEGSIESLLPIYQDTNPVAVEVVYQDAAYFEENAATVTKAGYRLWVNTMWKGLAGEYTDAAAMGNPDAYWGYLVSRGVNMIQTDEPKALLDYLRGRNLRQN